MVGVVVGIVERAIHRVDALVDGYADRTDWAARRRHGLFLALALAAVTDLVPVLVAGVPLSLPISGGGLYYHISTTIASQGFAYPGTIPYYSPGGIPFAYPPLVFYAIAVVGELTPISIRSLYAYLPVVFSLATVPVFHRFVREFTDDDAQVVIATLVYAVLGGLGSFVTGQGLVEVVGTLLFLGGLVAMTRVFVHGRRRYGVHAGVLFALTALSSPGGAFAFAVTLAVFAAFGGDDGVDFRGFAVVASVGIVGSAPWWATVVTRHGVGTLVTGFLSRQEFLLQTLYTLQFDPLGTVFWGALAFVGLFYGVVRGELLLPVWFVALLFAAETSYVQPIPGAVLVAVAVTAVVHPGFRRIADDGSGGAGDLLSDPGLQRTVTVCFVALVLVHGLGFALVVAQTSSGDVSQLDGVPRATTGSDAQVAAMAMARERTSPESEFLVVAPEADWPVSDWFPAIARRTAYVGYGTEWLDTSEYWAIDGAVDSVRTERGLQQVIREYEITPTHVYVVHNGATRPLRSDLGSATCAERIGRTPGASVYNVSCLQ